MKDSLDHHTYKPKARSVLEPLPRVLSIYCAHMGNLGLNLACVMC